MVLLGGMLSFNIDLQAVSCSKLYPYAKDRC